MKTSLFGTLLFGTLFALASCGGGSSGTGGSGVTTFGKITGFGSVIVNGVEFSTSGAMILRDDVPVTQGDLRVGMVVTVSGTHSGSSGDATRTAVNGSSWAKPCLSTTKPALRTASFRWSAISWKCTA